MASNMISFRVSDRILRTLEDKLDGSTVSPGGYARQLLMEDLGETKEAIQAQAMAELQREVRRLHEDLIDATRAIMKVAGTKEPYSKEKVDAWVDKNLARPRR